MIELRECSRLLPVVAGLLMLCTVSEISAEPTQRALIITPGGYKEFSPAPYLDVGAEALNRQLQAAGFEAENIVFLSNDFFSRTEITTEYVFQKLDELVNMSEPDDLLLVSISGHGMQISGSDYVALANVQMSEIDLLANQHNDHQLKHLISIQNLVETMSASVGHKLLLIDSPGSRSPVKRSVDFLPGSFATEQFGDQVLRIGQDTWTICNRSGRLTENDNAPAMTQFMLSVLEGFALHADANSDKTVSLLEISDYVSQFAEAESLILPSLQGKLNTDFGIVKTTRESRTDTLPQKVRIQLYRSMRSLAIHSLLFEEDPGVAVEALKRAKRYAHTPQLIAELKGLELTAMAAEGNIQQALHSANELGRPLLMVVPETTSIYEQKASRTETRNIQRRRRIVRRQTVVDPISGKLPSGSMVRVVEVSQTRIRFDQAHLQTGSESNVKFSTNNELSGWLNLSIFNSKTVDRAATYTAAK